MNINVKSGDKFENIVVTYGDNLLNVLANHGYSITANCGGNGKCGKCKVKLLSGAYQADSSGFILACKTNIISDIAIEVNEVFGTGLTLGNSAKLNGGGNGYGVALDIGTTTLAFYLVNLASGQQIDEFSMLNPQCSLGADVISRIKASGEGKLKNLNSLIINAVNQALKGFISSYNLPLINKLVVTGNTTMLHLFCNVDPTPMGVSPFTPVFTNALSFSGLHLGINAENVLVMPSISAYVGADIMSGIINCKLYNNDGAVLIDIGTNGEMAINSKGKILCCSTSAGPAFEGANISQGSGGVSGAINKVSLLYNKLCIETVAEKAKTICGCGLIDAVAVLIKNGIIDETGAFNQDYDGVLSEYIGDNKFYLTKDVAITQADIREVQLAKSAICAGLKTLINVAGISYNDISTLYIAGGLGFYINKESACAIGLIPKELKNKIVVVGNSSGSGAKEALTNNAIFELATTLMANCQTIDLATNLTFMDEYIENMFF